MTGPRVYRPKMDKDTARTITAIVKAEQRHLLTLPPGPIRERALSHCRAFLDALAEESQRATPARTKREVLAHLTGELQKAKADA